MSVFSSMTLYQISLLCPSQAFRGRFVAKLFLPILQVSMEPCVSTVASLVISEINVFNSEEVHVRQDHVCNLISDTWAIFSL